MELQTDKECVRPFWSSVDIKTATNFVMSKKSNLTIPSSQGKTDSIMLAKPLQFLQKFPKWEMLGIMWKNWEKTWHLSNVFLREQSASLCCGTRGYLCHQQASIRLPPLRPSKLVWHKPVSPLCHVHYHWTSTTSNGFGNIKTKVAAGATSN